MHCFLHLFTKHALIGLILCILDTLSLSAIVYIAAKQQQFPVFPPPDLDSGLSDEKVAHFEFKQKKGHECENLKKSANFD